MLKKLKRKIDLLQFRKKWRNNNTHNFTYAKNLFKLENVEVGNYTYGGISVLSEVKERKLHIGNYCSLAEEVLFLLGDDHFINNVSTFPFKAKVIKEVPAEATSKGDIIVDDDVWIGFGAKILSGVHIGQGAVVATGAVVTKDVPPYTIVGGVPARVLKHRFSDDLSGFLMTLDFSKLNEEMIREHLDDLYFQIDNLTIDKIKELYKWFPKKRTDI